MQIHGCGAHALMNVTHAPVDVNFTNSDPDDPPSGACTINGYKYRCVNLVRVGPVAKVDA